MVQQRASVKANSKHGAKVEVLSKNPSLNHPHIAALYGLEEFEGRGLLVWSRFHSTTSPITLLMNWTRPAK
jgi:hypothetical protein